MRKKTTESCTKYTDLPVELLQKIGNLAFAQNGLSAISVPGSVGVHLVSGSD